MKVVAANIVLGQMYSGQNWEKGYFMAFNFKYGQLITHIMMLKVEIGQSEYTFVSLNL